MKIFANLILIISMISCKTIKDDDKTPLIVHAYAEGTLSYAIFELKIDSSFRYWYNAQSLTKIDVKGFWNEENDTFYLHDGKNKHYGKVYLSNNAPRFQLNSNDSTLLDLTNKNLHWKYHNPSININFGVRR